MVFDLEFFMVLAPIFGAFFFQALTGMGGGLIAIPILSIFFSPHFAIPIVAIFQFLVGILILPAPVRRRVDLGIVARGLPSLIIGTLVGAFLLPVVDEQIIRVVLGGYVLFDLFYQNFLKGKQENLPNRLVLAGGALMSGMFGIGGPLFVMYLRGFRLDTLQFRATILAFYIISHMVRLPGFIASGVLTQKLLFTALPVLPFFCLALFLGHKLSKRLRLAHLHGLIQLFLVIAGLSLLGRAIYG